MQQNAEVRFRLGVSWHHQIAAIRRRQPHVQHLDGGEFLQHSSRRQSRSMGWQAMLQCHRQAVRQKSNQDVRLDSMFQLMVDGTNAQLTLQTFERCFDLHQLHVTVPQHTLGGKHGVRCNLVAPGFTLTEAAFKNTNEEYRNQMLASLRSPRLGAPEDIAAMVASCSQMTPLTSMAKRFSLTAARI